MGTFSFDQKFSKLAGIPGRRKISEGFEFGPGQTEVPSNFIAGRPKAALLFWFLMVVLLSICLLALWTPA